jgi:hypothetical protein
VPCVKWTTVRFICETFLNFKVLHSVLKIRNVLVIYEITHVINVHTDIKSQITDWISLQAFVDGCQRLDWPLRHSLGDTAKYHREVSLESLTSGIWTEYPWIICSVFLHKRLVHTQSSEEWGNKINVLEKLVVTQLFNIFFAFYGTHLHSRVRNYPYPVVDKSVYLGISHFIKMHFNIIDIYVLVFQIIDSLQVFRLISMCISHPNHSYYIFPPCLRWFEVIKQKRHKRKGLFPPIIYANFAKRSQELCYEIKKILLVNARWKLVSQTHQMRFALFHTYWSLIYRTKPDTCLYTLVVYFR